MISQTTGSAQSFNHFLNSEHTLTPIDFQRPTLRFDGRVHGCIVDLDFSNHLFFNPYDGTITPYHALSTTDKYIYKSVDSLIAANRPEMLSAYRKKKKPIFLENNKSCSSLDSVTVRNNLTALFSQYPIEPIHQDKDGYLYTDTYMYCISDFFKQLQSIYDHHLITTWHDDFLPPTNKEYPFEDPEAITGQCAKMTCGMTATVISDCGAKDITVEFKDGTIVEHTTRRKFKNKTVLNPNLSFARKKL